MANKITLLTKIESQNNINYFCNANWIVFKEICTPGNRAVNAMLPKCLSKKITRVTLVFNKKIVIFLGTR